MLVFFLNIAYLDVTKIPLEGVHLHKKNPFLGFTEA
jgi:hypothetical protein